jgi:TP901 family phage tail tape measure protein
MADEQIVTNIVANADFSNLSSELRRVTAQLTNLQDQANATNKALANQISVMNRQFGDTLRSTGQFTSHFVTIGSDVEKFGKNLDAGRGRLKDFYGAWQQHHKQAGGLIRDLARQQVQLQNSILQPLGRNADGMMKFAVHVPRGLDEIKNKTSLAKQELMIMNKVVQEGAGQLINWGKNTQWAGRQLTVGLTVPMVAFGKAASDAFRAADEELTRLTKVYGDLSKTSSANLKQVREDVSAVAKELAASMGASYNQTLALSADIAATGKTGNELLGSIRETTRLAVLGEVDRQEAMKATLAIQSAFKQNTDELSESINFLNAVENQTSTSLADLVEAIPKAGPVVKGLGGDVKDLALYLTAMREGGISASEGANALKSGLASLINPTKVAVGQFKGFGIDLLGIVNNNAGNVTATLLELQKALDTLDPLSKQQAIEQLFGKFQFSRMNALFENLGKQGSQTLQVLDLMKASSADLANIAGRELAQVTESASGKYRRALEELKADLATTGEQFLKISTYVLQFVDKIVDFANNLPGPIKTILGFFGGLTAVAGPLIMLTGVLGNFFGYIIKGVAHFKALFRGAEGWKMLTPEILAAQKAGDLAADTFYSDAKAAQVLNQALRDLTAQYDALAARASSGAVSVQPVLNNLAAQAAFGQRVVDPNNPLAGQMGTRASGHMVPRKVDQPRSIFGLVPTSIPVNAAIGENPMIYSQGDLPNVPGLTTISATRTIDGMKKTIPVSTGIVAEQAARHHAYTAALAMQGKQEFESLKKTLAITGTASKEFIDLFDDILPITSQLTTKAASQSAAIVAELNAGKLSIAQAREQIIALNIAIEQEMGVAVSQYAQSTGRNINLTNVPTLNQPVQSPTGKSNMRELFKQRTGGVFDRLASSLGVRTSGAGYNVHTTIPKRLNSGGYVYTANDGSIVPGPNINADVVPAMLTPGEFVVNAEATRANLPLLQAINGRGASGNRLKVGSDNPLEGLQRGHISNDLSAFMLYMDTDTNQRLVRGRVYKGFDGITGFEIAQSLASLKRRTGMHPASLLDNLARRIGGDPRYVEKMYREIIADLASPANRNKVFGGLSGASFEDLTEKHLLTLKDSKTSAGSNLYDTLKRVKVDRTGGKSKGLTLDGEKYGGTNTLKDANGKNIMRALLGTSSGLRGKIIDDLFRFSFGPDPDKRGASVESHGKKQTFLGMPLEKTPTGWGTFGTNARRFTDAMNTRMKFAPRLFRNKGGIIPGYNRGSRTPIGPLNALKMHGFWPGKASSRLNYDQMTGDLLPGPAPSRISGYGPQMIGSTAGYAAGSMFGPMGGMAGSIIGGFLPDIIVKIANMTKAAGGFANVALKVGKFLKAWSIPAVIVTVLALAGKKLWDMHKAAEALGKANRLAFGGTKESFASVGIKNYTTISDRIKEINKELDLNRAKVASSYSSFTKTGTSGVTLTVKQLDDAIKNAKKNQKDYVEGFNSIDGSRVEEYAANLKAQFLAMGLSAQDASNQIYAIVSASNKASQAVAAVSSAAFKSIQKDTDGIKYMVEFLRKQLSSKGFNAEEFSTGLDTLLNSLLVYRDALVGTVDKTGELTGTVNATVDEADALAATMKQVVSVQGSGKELSESQLENLKDQNFLYTAILGTNENIRSVTAKIMLYTAGFADNINLAAMSAKDAVQFAKNLALVQNAMNKLTEDTSSKNPLSGLAKILKVESDQAKKAADLAKKAKAVDEEYYKNKIKGIDKVIDKIKEEANARIKLLELEQDKINYNDELRKAKLEYEQALASGDMAAAASAQANVQKLIQDRQRALNIQNIQDRAEAAVKKEEERKQALQEEMDKLNNNYNRIQADSAKQLAESQLIQSYIDKLEQIALVSRGRKLTKEESEEVAVLLKEMKDAGGKLAEEAKRLEAKYPAVTTQSAPGPGQTSAQPGYTKSTQQTLIDSLNKALDSSVTGKFQNAVTKFDEAVEKFAGKTNTGFVAPQEGQYNDRRLQTDDTYMVFKNPKTGKTVYLRSYSGAYEKDYNYVVEKGYQFVNYQKSPGKNGNVYEDKYQVPKLKSGGSVKHFEPGGKVIGPGTGTSDSIPAMLSNGEYVIKADSVKKYGVDTFEALNSQRFADGGYIQHFKNGGAPHDMGMRWGAPSPKKLGWLQRYANNLTAQGQARSELVKRSKWTSWFAPFVDDPLGFNQFVRKIAGTDDNGSALAAALFFTNFTGLGAGAKLGLTGPGGKAGSLFPDNIFGQSNSVIKNAVKDIYQRKNVELDGSLYPTYSLSGQDGRIAFQGLNEDLSGLAKTGVQVVPVTPEGLLSAALKMSPNDKNIKSMLNNFNKDSISDTELAFLDSIAASIGISKKGKELANINTDGYAMVLSALTGNKGAQSIVGAKTKAFYEIMARNKQYSGIATKGGNAAKNIDEIDPSQVTMIHSTKFPVIRDKAGNILLNAYGHHNRLHPDPTKRVPRASIHLTAEDTVKGDHLGGSWSNEQTKIVTSLADLMKDNGLPYNLHAVDTWWMLNPGQALKIANGITVRTSKNEMQYAADLIKRGLIKPGDNVPLIANDAASKDVLQLFKQSYTQSDRDFILNSMIKNGRAGFRMEDVIGNENQLLEIIALQNAKKMLKINTPHSALAGEAIANKGLMDQMSKFAADNKIFNGLHNSSFPSLAEGSLHNWKYFNERLFGRGSSNPFSTGTPVRQMLAGMAGAADSIEAIRFIMRYGDSETGIKRLIREYGTNAATGGYINNGKLMRSSMSIPKFDQGINLVPQDMMALIHKNEAVVPANMNPFNPNANNATMGGQISIVNNITATPGMDEAMIAEMTTQKVIKALNNMDKITSARIGSSNVVTNIR